MPGRSRCAGCDRIVGTAGGGLDLLDDAGRVSADAFAARYRALRLSEGWVDPTGTAPVGGRPEPWGRLRSASRAATLVSREWPVPEGRVVADIGSGTGWAHPLFAGFGVIAFDILPTTPTAGALTVRADMRKLPLCDSTVDAAIFIASIHYVPLTEAVREAARVLKGGGLLLVVDSPVYRDEGARDRASARSAAYYGAAGHPELASDYHPAGLTELVSVVTGSGFALQELRSEGSIGALWQRVTRRPPSSLLVGRRVKV
ncbi:MAG TPA: methyltransferase domain-containing protein [Candidatus Dormibacteraeota bacterium]|nr:methyltransferase domain-containing protein [Candidatus Dormibacteraeota bacterium]